MSLQQNTDRILTTHVGSLPRPSALLDLMKAKYGGQPFVRDYLTEHYEGYDNVLVRLSRIKPGALEGLLQMAYKFRAATSRAVR